MRAVFVNRIGSTIVIIAAAVLMGRTASASPACVTTPFGIECTASGGSSNGGSAGSGGGDGSLPPIRYLVTDVDAVVGPCWYWSRYGPGLDSWNPADEHALIMTRTFTAECPDDPPAPQVTGTVLTTLAWNVFRSFPLPPPDPSVMPWPSGFTGIPSELRVARAPRFTHGEWLPDGTRLAVRAVVWAVAVRWGDGAPSLRHDPTDALRGIEHIYALKTCTAEYRRTHPAGGLCHPRHEAYPLDVTWVWRGSYLRNGTWVDLGEIRRTTRVPYDVDEIIGVPQR